MQIKEGSHSFYGTSQKEYLINIMCKNYFVFLYRIKDKKLYKIKDEVYISTRIMAWQRSDIGWLREPHATL